MATTLLFGLTLGNANAGLTDLRAQPLDANSSPSGSAISSGFTEIGGGNYTWSHSFTDGFSGFVKFYRAADSSHPYFTLAVNSGTADIPASGSPTTVNAYLYTRNASGAAVIGVTVFYRLLTAPTGGTGEYPAETQTVTSDGTGLATIVMMRNAIYQYWVGAGRPKTVAITNSTANPYSLPETTG